MTTTKPGALAALLNDIHTAVRHYSDVPEGTPLANVINAFKDHIGADWKHPLSQVLPEIEHTPKCVEMGWWMLHPRNTTCEPVPDDAQQTRDAQLDADHAVALVLNAAIDWENAKQRLHTEGSLIASADAVNAQIILHQAIRAYMPVATS